MRLRNLLNTAPDSTGGRPFWVLAEFVPGPGHDLRNFERFLKSYGEKGGSFAGNVRLAGVTIPQSPNGTASLSPADIASVLRAQDLWGDLDVVPHVTAKDHNLEGLKTYLLGLAKLGLETVLALTGDKPASGTGIFDVDSVGLIELIQEMNAESYQRLPPGAYARAPQFYTLAAVSPFKYTEGAVRQQYYKMVRKIRAGAGALVTQLGWDARKSEELFRVLGEDDVRVPVFGNVYLLSTATPAPRLMHEGKLFGCVVTKALFAKVTRESFAGHIERAAQQTAMYRDLGAAGVDVGGLPDYDTLVRILDRAGEIGTDWRRYRDNLDFGPKTLPGGKPAFYLYDEGSARRAAGRPKPPSGKRLWDVMHRTLLTPGRGLQPAAKRIFGASRQLRRGAGGLHTAFFAAEKAAKTLLYECEDCGDCFLPENFGLCTLGKCAKGMPNPPCGDADPDGRCGHDRTRTCVGELIYVAAASEGPAGLEKLAGLVNPPRDAALAGTSSILNHLFEKDHARKYPLIQIGENIHASIPRPAAAMKELLAAGPGAFDRPGAALDYLISLVTSQARHGADYIEVNVDAFGEQDPALTPRMIRDYVRLIRLHGNGVPVCVDSGVPEVLRAGLEAWYEGAPAGIAPPLLNSVKTYTLDAVLPLRKDHPFKFIGLLVDVHSTGSEGSYYGIDELTAMAKSIFEAATGRYGFRPGDIFFDSTVFPLAIDMPMTPDTPGYTYRTFETIRRLKTDPAMKGVHFSLGITNAVRDLPGRRTGVCRAYLAKAMEYGLDAGIVNVLHDFGKRPAAADLAAFVEAFAAQDGSAEAAQRAITAMMDFCKANRRAKDIPCG
jgi:methylenetetrahydrofolate reductase (NADPH)